MDWVSLETQIVELSREVFSELRTAQEKEEFYAYALYTDSSAMTIVPSANSIQALNNNILQEDESERSEDVVAYYKWSSSEWAYEAFKGDKFSEINKNIREDRDRSDFPEFKKKVIGVMTSALASLVREGFFEQGDEKSPVVFVTVSDDDEAEAVENASARIINKKSVYEYFIKRYGAL